ncbi:TlpA disulfide reductase family protein [Spirosoma montaniterrae]|uniref:Alkyl hydroperoxide reductase n=1 Tax=Spirosoma montaniterrae TaxID=1178516 RepID=A0A1P9X417_9BACT|nr:TlpA disulfide reductase family protein [Spirosoma montaniterrae]AQG82347.1 alkyl hydroperoxide reductase [Spirosoma montaniterrae]
MKNYLLLIFVFLGSPSRAQFRYSPATPQVGQTVSFTYSPQGTPLAADSLIEGRHVRYGAPSTMHLSRPTSVTLVRQGNDFVGEVRAPKADVAGLAFLFRNPQQPQRVDLNKGKLYVVPVCDENGQSLPHATGGQASVFMRTGFLYEAGSRPDPNWVVALYEQELKQHPDLRPLYWSDYYAALIKQKKPGYGPTVKAGIESYLSSRQPPTPAEFMTAAQLYESMGDFPKAKQLRERQKTADPGGSLVQKDRAMAVRNEPDWTKKKAAYQAYAREFPTSSQLPALSILMADSYYKNNDINGLVAFVEKLPPTQIDVLMLSTIAFKMADEQRALPDAERIIRRAIAVQQLQSKPGNLTPTAWATEQQTRQRQLMNTLARTLEQQGKFADAYTAYQSVINLDEAENSDPRTNERYFLCALRTNHAADARPMAEAAISTGRATTRLKAALREWYARQPGQTPAKADAYIADLEADLMADKRDELREKLIDEPAPAFALTDLLGRTISSTAFKGKVIVLDFWATWCGPCVASFPAMQQAQARFQSDPNVRFLFVNTREGGPLSRVHNFMERNPYPFVVPLDTQQRVANAYKVKGIPTKVVIGPNGRVRYRSVGYNGSPEATVEELALIVEMLK